MSRPASGLRRAVAFLTPLGGAVEPAPAALPWFPVVGAAMGAALGCWWWLVARAWPAPVAAALLVGADLALTGMLHFDGLLDSADGLLSHLPLQRRLAVMAAPDVGAFAIAVGGVVLLARWASVSTLRPAPLLIAGLWCGARTLMAVTMRTQPYAKPEGGLATAFAGGPGRGASLLLGTLVALALAAAWRPLAGPVALASGAAAGGAVILVARRQLGGFTGDVLGAAGVVCETVGLVVAAAKW